MDNSTHMLLEIALILVIAGISSVVFTKLRFPAVIGYLAAGMILGPRGIGSVLQFDMDTIDFLANLGIVLLMFSIGLEFNLNRLRKIGSFAILAGGVEVCAMLGIGFTLAHVLGYSFVESIFMGAILSISSTAVILSVLKELGKLKEEYVESLIGILIVEDLAAVILLTMTSPLLTGQVPRLSATITILVVILLFIGFSLVLGLAVVPKLIDRVDRGYSSETLLLVALGLSFSMALVANQIGLSVAIGSFIMGVIIGHARAHLHVEQKVAPIKEMFLAVFFVSIGMLVQPLLVLKNIVPAIVIALVFILGKMFAVTLGSYISNMPVRTSFLAGASMVAMGEFSFIIAKQGNEAGALTDAFYSAVIGAALITMVLLPVCINRAPRWFNWFVTHTPKGVLGTMRVIEGVRMDVRRRLALSAEKRRQVRRELFWIFVDLIIIVLISFLSSVLLAFSLVLDPIARAIGIIPSVLALVVTIALSMPVVISMVNKMRNIVRLLAASALDTKPYQTLSGTLVYRMLKKLVRLLVVVVILLAIVPFAYVFDQYQSGVVLIFVLIGVLFGYLLWDFFHSGYMRLQDALAANIVEGQEEERS